MKLQSLIHSLDTGLRMVHYVCNEDTDSSVPNVKQGFRLGFFRNVQHISLTDLYCTIFQLTSLSTLSASSI